VKINSLSKDIRDLIGNFLESNKHLIGDVEYNVKERIDAARFPDDIGEKFRNNKSGIYIFSSKINNKIIYIGIAQDIIGRFYQHKGTNFSWTRNGSKACFPNIFKEQHWLPDETKNILKNGEFYVTAITLDPFKVAHLIESFLIFKLGPAVNVNGK
jgi:hypothetical protein